MKKSPSLSSFISSENKSLDKKRESHLYRTARSFANKALLTIGVVAITVAAEAQNLGEWLPVTKQRFESYGFSEDEIQKITQSEDESLSQKNKEFENYKARIVQTTYGNFYWVREESKAIEYSEDTSKKIVQKPKKNVPNQGKEGPIEDLEFDNPLDDLPGEEYEDDPKSEATPVEDQVEEIENKIEPVAIDSIRGKG